MRKYLLNFFLMGFAAFFQAFLPFSFAAQEPNEVLVTKCWEYFSILLTKDGFASDNANKIFLSLSNGKIISLDLLGRQIWLTELPGEVISPITFYQDNLLFIQKNSNESLAPKLISLSAETGLTNWQTNLSNPSNSENFQFFFPDQKILVLGNKGQYLLINPLEKKIESTFEFTDFIFSSFTSGESDLFFLSSDSSIKRFSILKNQLEKLFPIKMKDPSFLKVLRGGFLVSSRSGQLTFYDPNGLKIWENRMGAGAAFWKVLGDFILVESFDNFLYYVSKKNGKIIWKKRFEGKTASETLSGKHLLISSLINGSKVVFSDFQNGNSVNQIVLQDGDYFTGKPLIIGEKLFFMQGDRISAYQFGQCTK